SRRTVFRARPRSEYLPRAGRCHRKLALTRPKPYFPVALGLTPGRADSTRGTPRHACLEDEPPPAGYLLPPATTQRRSAAPTTPFTSEPRIAPPFVARPTTAQPLFELVEDEPTPEAFIASEPEPQTETELLLEPQPAPQTFEAAPIADDEDHRWEEVLEDE